jgi:ribosomal protein L30E
MGSVLTADPKEAAQIMQANFPGVQVRESPEGLIATSSKDGAEYLIPNSFTSRDVLPTVAKTIPYAALGAAGPASATFGGAAIEATQEYLKQRAGGNPVDASKVLTTGLVSGAVPGLAPLAGVGYKTLAERVGPLLRGARPAATAVDDVARVANDAPTPSAPIEAPAPQPSAPSQTRNDVPLFPEEQMWAKPSAPPATAPVAEVAAPQPNRFAPLPDEVMGRQPVMATGEGLGGRAAPAEPKAPPPAQVSTEVPPVNYDDLAQLMRAASEGDTDAAVRLGQLMQQQDPRVVEAAKALGFGEDDLPLDWFLANRSAQEIVQLAKSQSGSLLSTQHYAAVGRVGARAQTLLEELGGTRDLSALDAGVKAEMQATQANLKKQTGALYDQLRGLVTPSARVPADNLTAWLTQRKTDLGGILDGMEGKIASRLAGGNPTYGYLDSLRAEIGEAVGAGMKRNAYSDLETGVAKQLYKAAVADIEAAATGAGAGEVLKIAKQSARAQKDIEKAIVNLFGKDISGSLLTSLESGVKSLSKGDVTKLVKVMQNVPANLRTDVMATAMNAAFNRSFRQGEMSFKGFADWYDRLTTNNQAMALVMSNLPKGAPAQLKALADLSRAVTRASPLAKTGYINQMTLRDALAKSDTLIHNLVGLAKRTSVGMLVEPMTSAMGMPGAGLTSALVASLVKGRPNTLVELDQLLSTPEFRRLVKAIGTPEEKAAVKSLARHGIMAKFFGSITGKKGTVADRERWIEESMTKKAPQ